MFVGKIIRISRGFKSKNLAENFCNIRVNVNPEKFKIELSKLITPDMDVYKELEDCIFLRK